MTIKSFIISLFSVSLAIIFLLWAGFGSPVSANHRFEAAAEAIHPSLIVLASSSSVSSNNYIYAEGAVSHIGSSSITLTNGVTYLIDGNTVCSAPNNMGAAGGNMEISCSELTLNQTVTIEAVQNKSGQLVAVKIAVFPS
jgi:hypothetical protein